MSLLLKDLHHHLHFLRRTQLWLQILLGMTLGILVGYLCSPSKGLLSANTASSVAGWLSLPGHIFLTLIQSVVIGLVVSSIIIGLNSSQDKDSLKRVSTSIIPYFLLTTTAACAIGIALTMILRPGEYIHADLVSQTIETTQISAQAAGISNPEEHGIANIPAKIVSLIPANFLKAAVSNNMLQIVAFTILIGLALRSIGPARSQPLLSFFASLQAVSMKVVAWAMILAPWAVFGLLAEITIQIGIGALVTMSAYVGTVLLGLTLLLVLYLAIVAVFSRMSPFRFLASIRDVMLLAFSTSSSAAVMPLSIKAAEERLDVQPTVSQLVIPLGATVDMAGTALYQVVAAVFLTQVFNISLSPAGLVVLTVTTVGASIGTPSAPGVGIVVLATILSGIGVPTTGIALIIGVDRILDMCRTSVNVTGDLVGCVVANRFIKKAECGG